MLPDPLSVLLVEDDPDTRENVSDILELDGHETISCADCSQAISYLDDAATRGIAPMAAIVDWQLPDGDADLLIPRLLKRIPNLPIVIVTGYGELDISISALRAGAYDYILKPINADVLRSTINRIRERRQHILQIEATQKRLVDKERLAAIGQMVAGLAHESRNALQRSQACLETLALDMEDRPDSLKLVHKIQLALDDLHGLYEEVRDYSAPINLRRCSSNLCDLINEAWSEVRSLSGSSISFRCATDDSCPPIIDVDPSRIRQVFRNLLENSLMACESQGQIEASIKRERSSSNDQVHIIVKDNGEGIANDVMPKLFEPFFTTKTKGTGLGLAITKRIVEAHDGTIEADANPDGGARFQIWLPCPTHEALPHK